MHDCTKVPVKGTPFAFSIGCVSALFFPGPATAQSARGEVTNFNRASSPEDRDWNYHFLQGSRLISYDIFLNLGIAGGQELFPGVANSERRGFGSRLSGAVG